jgi:hypothetical protein
VEEVVGEGAKAAGLEPRLSWLGVVSDTQVVDR